jgi:prepilin signal peptidase PulO-like enzyme (type II secretory pathway)
VFLFLFLVTRGKGMGLGDAKLAVPLGMAAGFPAGIDVLLFSFWIGTIVGIVLLSAPYLASLVHRRRWRQGDRAFTMKSEVPFAPFLIVAFALISFTSVSVTTFFGFPLW